MSTTAHYSKVCVRCAHFITSHATGICQNCRIVECSVCQTKFIWRRFETKLCRTHKNYKRLSTKPKVTT